MTLPETIHNPGAIEVEPRRGLVLQRVKAGAPGEGVPTSLQAVPAQCFEERMPRRDPFQVVGLFRRLPVSGQARIAEHETFSQLPVWVRDRIALSDRGRAARIKRMGQAAVPA